MLHTVTLCNVNVFNNLVRYGVVLCRYIVGNKVDTMSDNRIVFRINEIPLDHVLTMFGFNEMHYSPLIVFSYSVHSPALMGGRGAGQYRGKKFLSVFQYIWARKFYLV